MPIATISTNTVAAGWTKSTLGAGLQAAMINAGFSLVEMISGTDDKYIFSADVAPTAQRRYAYIQTVLTSGNIFNSTLSDNWNTTTKTATGGVLGGNSTAPSTANSIMFRSINHPEVRLVHMLENASTMRQVFGIIRPANPPDYWSNDDWLYALLPVNAGFLDRGCFCQPNPWGFSNTSSQFLATAEINTALRYSTPIGNGQGGYLPGDLAPFLHTWSFPTRAGRWSEDILLTAAAGLGWMDTITVGLNVYTLFYWGTTTNASLGIRTA